MPKWFVSCIIPNVRPIGGMQFEAEDDEDTVQNIAEGLNPCECLCSYKAYQIQEFDPEIPIGEFVDSDTLKEHGYGT